MEINAVYCVKCKEFIHSKSVHDFVWCKGKHVYVDGGNDYQRIGWDPDEEGAFYIVKLVEPFSSK